MNPPLAAAPNQATNFTLGLLLVVAIAVVFLFAVFAVVRAYRQPTRARLIVGGIGGLVIFLTWVVADRRRRAGHRE